MVAIWLDDTVCNYRDRCLYVHGCIVNMSWQWLSGIYFTVGAQLPLINQDWFQADTCSNRKMAPSVLQNYLISPYWWPINAFPNVSDGGIFLNRVSELDRCIGLLFWLRAEILKITKYIALWFQIVALQMAFHWRWPLLHDLFSCIWQDRQLFPAVFLTFEHPSRCDP